MKKDILKYSKRYIGLLFPVNKSSNSLTWRGSLHIKLMSTKNLNFITKIRHKSSKLWLQTICINNLLSMKLGKLTLYYELISFHSSNRFDHKPNGTIEF